MVMLKWRISWKKDSRKSAKNIDKFNGQKKNVASKKQRKSVWTRQSFFSFVYCQGLSVYMFAPKLTKDKKKTNILNVCLNIEE